MARIIPLAFLLMYAYFILLQFNDPDPLIWVGLYGVAAAFCILAFLKKGNPIVSAVAIAGFVALAVLKWPAGHFEGVTGPMELSPNIENARESLGLAICALTTLICLFIARSPKSSASA